MPCSMGILSGFDALNLALRLLRQDAGRPSYEQIDLASPLFIVCGAVCVRIVADLEDARFVPFNQAG